ncbi:MAG: DUF2946 family protein [Beijerinckiaceae bacterium]
MRGRAGAWFAGLALYVQIIAGAFCVAGTANAAFDTLPDSPFPICRSQRGDEASAQTPDGGQAPAHHHSCPFCSVHGQATMAPPPSVAGLEIPLAVSMTTEQAAFIFPSPARFRAGAPPRGPPSAV